MFTLLLSMQPVFLVGERSIAVKDLIHVDYFPELA